MKYKPRSRRGEWKRDREQNRLESQWKWRIFSFACSKSTNQFRISIAFALFILQFYFYFDAGFLFCKFPFFMWFEMKVRSLYIDKIKKTFKSLRHSKWFINDVAFSWSSRDARGVSLSFMNYDQEHHFKTASLTHTTRLLFTIKTKKLKFTGSFADYSIVASPCFFACIFCISVRLTGENLHNFWMRNTGCWKRTRGKSCVFEMRNVDDASPIARGCIWKSVILWAADWHVWATARREPTDDASI